MAPITLSSSKTSAEPRGSKNPSKQQNLAYLYLVPAFPALALLLAAFLEEAAQDGLPAWVRGWGSVGLVLVGLAMLLSFATRFVGRGED